MIDGGGSYGGGDRGERRLVWPPAPGSELGPLAAELAASIDAAAQAGSALTLIELSAGGAAAATQLCERLAAHWQAGGRRCLIVDGHPTAPFFSVLFTGSPEGFTEILHYGLSPAAATLERPHCAGLWIPAGGRWALPLESPEEPQLTLSRLLGEAERVLLLADAGNAEGLLPALRAGCHFHLRLEAATALPAVETAAVAAAPPAPVAAVPTPTSATAPLLTAAAPPPVATPPVAPVAARLQAPAAARSPRRRPALGRLGGRGLWPILLLPAGLLVLLLGVYLITGPWGGSDAPGERSIERGAGDAFTPLPAPAALPYAAPPGEASAAPADASAPADEASAPTANLSAGLASSGDLALPPAATPAAGSPPAGAAAARTGALKRRFEPEGAWARLQSAPGPFFVHLESFRDSALAAEAAGRPAARRVGVRLAPATVEGVRWYRLWLGPFAELATAAACRDSLLDRAGEDYCRIVTASP